MCRQHRRLHLQLLPKLLRLWLRLRLRLQLPNLLLRLLLRRLLHLWRPQRRRLLRRLLLRLLRLRRLLHGGGIPQCRQCWPVRWEGGEGLHYLHLSHEGLGPLGCSLRRDLEGIAPVRGRGSGVVRHWWGQGRKRGRADLPLVAAIGEAVLQAPHPRAWKLPAVRGH